VRNTIQITNGKKRCSKCKKDKPLSAFTRSKKLKCGYESQCKDCKRPAIKAWNKRRPAADKNKTHRKSIMKVKYGLSEEQYLNLLSAQGNRCAICNCSFQEKRVCIDHCHETGIVRGLLCANCNTGLGHFKDDTQSLQSAIEYLFKFGKVK
jgi:hypothetical protein